MQMQFARAIACALVAGATAIAGCGGGATPRQGGPFAGDAANATYRLAGQEVRVTGGQATVGEGDAAVVVQVTEARLEGDLNGDATTDLLVVVARDEAGGGATFHLAALVSEGATWKAVDAIELGERMVVKNLAFEGPDIKLRLVVPDPENADPRPSKVVERRFRFQGGALVALEPPP